MVTRDVLENGLVCVHCSRTGEPLEKVQDKEAVENLSQWAETYAPIHGVAHWDEERRKSHKQYEQAFEQAAQESERQLSYLGSTLAPPLLDYYPMVLWEDQDECLQVRPEDIQL